jgi:hypothetical protein
MTWKYIIAAAGNQEWPVIFPGSMVHRLMADRIKDYFAMAALEMSNGVLSPAALLKLREEVRIVSAGEISFDTGECTGGSDTLGVRAREHDASFIRSYTYHGGQVR